MVFAVRVRVLPKAAAAGISIKCLPSGRVRCKTFKAQLNQPFDSFACGIANDLPSGTEPLSANLSLVRL